MTPQQAANTIREALPKLHPDNADCKCSSCEWVRNAHAALKVLEDAAKRAASDDSMIDAYRIEVAAQTALADAAVARAEALTQERDDLLWQRTELQNSIGSYVVTVDDLCRQRADAWARISDAERVIEMVNDPNRTGKREAKEYLRRRVEAQDAAPGLVATPTPSGASPEGNDGEAGAAPATPGDDE